MVAFRWGRGMGLLEAFVEHDSALNPRNTFFCIAFYLAIFFLGGQTASLPLFLHLVHSPHAAVDFVESKAGLGAAKAELYISVFWAAGNVWLAYVLFLVLKDMCVVCISMYVVNATILACSYSRYSDLSSKDGRKKK